MSETSRTGARLRELVAKWGRGEDADSHIIEDLTDFTGSLERELSAAQAKLAALLEPRDYGDLIYKLRAIDPYNATALAEAAAAIEQLQAQLREAKAKLAKYKEDEERLRAVLELVWTIETREHIHLGLERRSGFEGDCIVCICALALGRAMDPSPSKEEFELRREAIKANDAARRKEGNL